MRLSWPNHQALGPDIVQTRGWQLQETAFSVLDSRFFHFPQQQNRIFRISGVTLF